MSCEKTDTFRVDLDKMENAGLARVYATRVVDRYWINRPGEPSVPVSDVIKVLRKYAQMVNYTGPIQESMNLLKVLLSIIDFEDTERIKKRMEDDLCKNDKRMKQT